MTLAKYHEGVHWTSNMVFVFPLKKTTSTFHNHYLIDSSIKSMHSQFKFITFYRLKFA